MGYPERSQQKAAFSSVGGRNKLFRDCGTDNLGMSFDCVIDPQAHHFLAHPEAKAGRASSIGDTPK